MALCIAYQSQDYTVSNYIKQIQAPLQMNSTFDPLKFSLSAHKP